MTLHRAIEAGIIQAPPQEPMSPLQTAILIIALVTIIGVVVSFMRKSSALAGYDEIKAEVPRVASAIRAEMFRDGEDLVLTGNYQGRPTQVRFSYAENTPGLNIRMQAPVSFTFSVVPKGARATEGRVLVRTGNDMFDAKFASRTDHPTQAKMLVGGRASLASIEKLCCSQKTFLTMTRGSMELSELVIPTPYTGRHVMDHIESMAVVAKTVEEIPGAESVKVVPYEREKSAPVFRLALVAGAVAAILAVFFLKPSSTQADLKAAGGQDFVRAEGVDTVDAAKIGNLRGWRALRTDEVDPEIVGAAKSSGLDGTGKIPIDLNGNEAPDVAYILRNEQGKDRLVILQDNGVVYDTVYNGLVGGLPVAASGVSSITWRVRPRALPENTGGVMLFSRSNDTLAPVILLVNGRNVASGTPQDWRAVSLK